MRDPFKIDPEQPTGVSFSGGRTSAYLLWRILEANGGLPQNVKVCFANTCKEAEASLRFVRECGLRWQVPITWLEYRDDSQGFAVVDFASASRLGEPFEALIRKRRYLPNPVARLCTAYGYQNIVNNAVKISVEPDFLADNVFPKRPVFRSFDVEPIGEQFQAYLIVGAGYKKRFQQ
jgi:hypothetical protein